jgi:LPS sulfotransferase NodH
MKTQAYGKSEAAAAAAADNFEAVADALPVVLNSLPKSGTVLSRNILMGFYGTKATRAATLGWRQYVKNKTFADLCEPQHQFLIGHFPYHPISNQFIRSFPHPLRMIICIRHPLDNCYSLARHYFRPGMQSKAGKAIKEKGLTFEEMVTYCISGMNFGGEQVQNVMRRYTDFLIWRQPSFPTLVIKYEDLLAALRNPTGAEQATFFERLLGFCGISLPDDWEARIKAMASPALAWTHVSHDSEQDRYPNRAHFLELMNSLYPMLLDFTGYRPQETGSPSVERKPQPSSAGVPSGAAISAATLGPDSRTIAASNRNLVAERAASAVRDPAGAGGGAKAEPPRRELAGPRAPAHGELRQSERAAWIERLLRGSKDIRLVEYIREAAEISLLVADEASVRALAPHMGAGNLAPRIVRERNVPKALSRDPSIRRILVIDAVDEEAARARLSERLKETDQRIEIEIGTFLADLLPLVLARRPIGELDVGPPRSDADAVFYAIVSTPQSGSAFLAELLHSVGLGNPIEHVRPWLVDLFANRPPHVLDAVRFTQRLIGGARSGPVFGTTLMHNVLAGLASSLSPSEIDFFRGLAARTTLVYLRRRDKLIQALSSLHARRASSRHSTDSGSRQSEQPQEFAYNFGEISDALKRCLRMERRLTQLITGHRRLIVVEYDELAASPAQVCRDIAARLGVPMYREPTAKAKTSLDEASQAFARRFLREATQRGVSIDPIPPAKDLLHTAHQERRQMTDVAKISPQPGPFLHKFPYADKRGLLRREGRKFVVALFTGRTGTTFIQHSLNQHPEIIFEGEFLAEFRNEPNAVEMQDQLLTNFFERGARDDRVHAFKTKMQDVKDPSILRRHLIDNNCVVIHSYRKNLIKQCISGERSLRLVEEAKKNTGVNLPYNLTANGVARGVKPLGKMHADKRKLDGALAYFKTGADQLREFIESLNGVDVIDVAYEDLNANKSLVLDALIAYMGLAPTEWEETILKHTSDNLREVIENFDEIANLYRGTQYYEMFFKDDIDDAKPALAART